MRYHETGMPVPCFPELRFSRSGIFISFIAIEFADGMAYSETIEFQNDSEKVKVKYPEIGWFVVKEGGCTKARLLKHCCLVHD